MIPQAHITAWRSVVAWADDAQVEQDLVLSRAVVELFSDTTLKDTIALRGGTALNKLFIRPACRYSEDIDLVQARAAPIGPIMDLIRGRLDAWLGKPKRDSAKSGVTLMYRFDSEIPPVRPLRLKVEINTREQFTVFGFRHEHLNVDNPWFSGTADVTTYAIDELIATKLRALYQRKKGRDLFDLWLCLQHKLADPEKVIECFSQYMRHQKRKVTRAEFEKNLHAKATDTAFLNDLPPLLAEGVTYEPTVALQQIQDIFLQRLPGKPWRGTRN
jgi:predicted nucleotidyltransferase component of viral defense system